MSFVGAVTRFNSGTMCALLLYYLCNYYRYITIFTTIIRIFYTTTTTNITDRDNHLPDNIDKYLLMV